MVTQTLRGVTRMSLIPAAGVNFEPSLVDMFSHSSAVSLHRLIIKQASSSHIGPVLKT